MWRCGTILEVMLMLMLMLLEFLKLGGPPLLCQILWKKSIVSWASINQVINGGSNRSIVID